MLNLILLLPMVAGYIISDSGWFQKTHYLVDSQFSCQNNYQHSYIIPYSQEFLNLPQITFFWKLLDLFQYSTEFQLDISNINTVNFTITITCPQNMVYGIEIFWFAIDDQRIQIISQFNTKDFKSKMIFEHENPNVDFGIIIPTSFAFSGPFNLSIQITEITPQNVSIEIKNLIENNQNLNQLGYQIILGPKNAFTFIEQRTLSSPYQSNLIEKQPQSWFFLIIQQLIYNQQDNLNYVFNSQEDQSSISYIYPQWGIFNEIIIKVYWVKYQLIKSYRSLQLKKIEIFYTQIPTQSIMPQLQVEISTLSDFKQIFNSTGIFSLLIGNLNNVLTFKISYICQQSEVVKINLYTRAFNNEYYNSFDCNIQINQIKYHIEFKVQYDAYQQLILNLTDKNCQVEQILYNQVKSSEKIIELNAT